jgi:hypothetical protein
MTEKDDIELNEQEEKLYIRGFNAGYVMEQENPKLLKQLITDKQNENDLFVKGMDAGSKEKVRERYVALALEKLSKSKQKGKDYEQDR